jgi:hypothetical protein
VDKQTLFEQLQTMKLDDSTKDPEIWIMELQQVQSKLSEMGEYVSERPFDVPHLGQSAIGV